ncbi:MAG: ATP-binding protein, partial [Desulfobacterales bacterium]|nr:ATP-binding protein [Desulfobacterales bacterium]
ALKIDAVWIKKNGGTDHGRRMKRIQQMCDFIDKSFDDIKGLALRLRPKVLDDMGLSIALRWLCKDFQARNKVVCKVNIQDLQIQSDIVSTALYRIAQESLTNVMRHANATQVRLSLLETESDGLVLTVEDNGNGFDPDGIREKEALGMAGMIERAELIGARLAVDSSPGQGCRIRLHMKHPHKKDTIK